MTELEEKVKKETRVDIEPTMRQKDIHPKTNLLNNK